MQKPANHLGFSKIGATKFASKGRAGSKNAPDVTNGGFYDAALPLYLALLAIFPLPVVAQSQWGVLPATAVNSTKINFGGHEWVVIGNNDKDIYKNSISGGTYINGAYGGAGQPDDSVTLLSIKNDFAGGTNVVFRAGSGGSCYGNAYAGTCNNEPNEYEGSDLQGQMAGAAPVSGSKEREVINARDLVPLTATYISNYDALRTADGMIGAAAQTQLYWALSLPEWEAIAKSAVDDNTNGVTVRNYSSSSWWLRSPDNDMAAPLPGGLAAATTTAASSAIRRMLSAPLSI